MSIVWSANRACYSRFRLLAVPGAVILWAFAGCVDTTPPWEKVAARGGAGGAGGEGGAALDGAMGSGGSLDAGAGGAIDLGSTAKGGASGEAGGAIDAPSAGAGGAIDAGMAGAGGGLDSRGSVVDVPFVGTGGASGGVDGGRDVPSSGTGGVPGTGGTRGTGGTLGTGGTSGRSGAGGSGAPDVGPDLGPDLPSGGVEAGTLLSGLVAYYPCEGASPDGFTLTDLSGNGNDGTLTNGLPPDGGAASTGTGYSFQTGKVGNALLLRASAYGYVSLPVRVFSGLTDITISTWVKITTAITWEKLLDVGINAHLSNAVTSGLIYMCMAPTTSNKTFAIAKDGTRNEQDITGSSSLTPSNGWTHLAVVLSAASETIYINGAAATTKTNVTLRPKDLGTIDYAYLGRSQFTNDTTFDGAIDEFRVYNRALSADEIQALYQYQVP